MQQPISSIIYCRTLIGSHSPNHYPFKLLKEYNIVTDKKSLKEFREFRQRMNQKIYDSGHLGIKRFFTLDTKAYAEGAIPVPMKELMGLVASMVLRCDDCISYHIVQGVIEGVSDEQFWEAFNIALVVGGSIVIPHLRRAVDTLEECRVLEEENPDELKLQSGNNPYSDH